MPTPLAPLPVEPIPGRLDEALDYLLLRAVPDEAERRERLRRMHGWTVDGSIEPMPEGTAHGRTGDDWRLHRLLRASTGPAAFRVALTTLETAAPCWASQATAALVDRGLTIEPLHPLAVLRLADQLHARTDLMVTPASCGDGVVATRSTVRGWRTTAGRLLIRVVNHGTVRVDERVDTAALPWATAIDDRLLVVGNLVMRRDDTSSFLAHHITRALAACGELTVDDLMTGLSRAARPYQRDRLPTVEELTVYLEHQPAYALHNGRATLVQVADRFGDDRPIDAVIVGALRRAGAEGMTGTELTNLLIQAGYRPGSGFAFLSRMPYVRTIERGRYVLASDAARSQARR